MGRRKAVDELTVEAFEIEDKEDLIDEIMNKYGQEVLQLVYSYVNNKEVAEDLTQDIFVKCYKSLHTYKGNSNLKHGYGELQLIIVRTI